MQDLDLFWWEEPTTAERECLTNEVARQSPIRVATGEQFDKIGKFFTLAEGGGVSIWQPEPMSLGGIINTMAVAHLAEANGAWIAPHQSGARWQQPFVFNWRVHTEFSHSRTFRRFQ